MFNSNKYSIFGVFVTTGKYIKQAIGEWRIFADYALILTCLSVIFGNLSYSCGLDRPAWWCYRFSDQYTAFAMLGANLLLSSIFLGGFVYDLYNSLFRGQEFISRNIFKFSLSKIKTICFLIGLILIIVSSVVGIFMIFNKEPNPDWRIEFNYFLIVFILCVLPLFLFRISAIVGYFLENNKLGNPLLFMKETSGKGYVGVVSFLVIFLGLNMLYFSFNRDLGALVYNFDYFATACFVDFAGSILRLIYIAVLALCFCAENELLKNKDSSSKDDNYKPAKADKIVSDEPQNKEEEPKAKESKTTAKKGKTKTTKSETKSQKSEVKKQKTDTKNKKTKRKK